MFNAQWSDCLPKVIVTINYNMYSYRALFCRNAGKKGNEFFSVARLHPGGVRDG